MGTLWLSFPTLRIGIILWKPSQSVPMLYVDSVCRTIKSFIFEDGNRKEPIVVRVEFSRGTAASGALKMSQSLSSVFGKVLNLSIESAIKRKTLPGSVSQAHASHGDTICCLHQELNFFNSQCFLGTHPYPTVWITGEVWNLKISGSGNPSEKEVEGDSLEFLPGHVATRAGVRDSWSSCSADAPSVVQYWVFQKNSFETLPIRTNPRTI